MSEEREARQFQNYSSLPLHGALDQPLFHGHKTMQLHFVATLVRTFQSACFFSTDLWVMRNFSYNSLNVKRSAKL